MEPRVRTNENLPRHKTLIAGLLFLACCIVSSGCHKTVKITLTPEDVQRASASSQEGDIAFGRKDHYAALIKLGIAYSQLKYYEQAIDAFLRSIEINRKYSYSYNNLGSVYFAQKSLKRAEKYFKKALTLKNDEASFHMNMGSLHLERKRRDKAMAEWRKGLALDPNILTKSSSVSLVGASSSSMERRYFMARLLASSGEVEMAIESLKQAITEGFSDIDLIRKEPDFDRIRNDKRFVDFVENAGLLIKLRSKVGLPEDTR
jgi:tetratricopeptide (TPR) repeat protein